MTTKITNANARSKGCSIGGSMNLHLAQIETSKNPPIIKPSLPWSNA